MNTINTKANNTCNCGSFGCVLYPSINCKNIQCTNNTNTNQCNNSKYVTKIFFDENEKIKEFEKYNELKLELIDPDMNYFISKPTECSELDIENIKTKLKKCKSKKTNNNITRSPIYGLNYIYGGVSLYELYFNEQNRHKSLDEFINLLNSLLNVFIGIKILHKKEIYHLDLKLENIVLDLKSPTPQCMLIDFGTSIKDEPLKSEKYKVIGTQYYMAPEMYILNTFCDNNNIDDIDDLDTKINMIDGDVFIEYSYDYSKNNNIVGYFKYYKFIMNDIDKIDIYNNLYVKLSNIIGCQNLNDTDECSLLEYFKTNTNIRYIKADIWSLGIILYILYAIINNNKYADLNIETNKNIILSKLLDVIKSLLIINPIDRPNADGALELYKKFLDNLLQPLSNQTGGKMIYESKKIKKLQKKYKTCKRKHCSKLSSNSNTNIKKCYKSKYSKQGTELQKS